MNLITEIVHLVTTNWLIILVSCIPAAYWYLTRNFDYWTKRGITGPPNTPIIGNFFSTKVPIPILYQNYMKQYGKCYGVFQGSKPSLVISEPELIKRILVKDFYSFRNRTAMPSGHRVYDRNLSQARDEEWKRIRSILTPMFTSLKLRKMEDQIKGCVGALIEWLDVAAKSGRTFEVRDPIGNFTMDVISKCAFATETNAHKETDSVFLRNAKAFFSFNKARFLAMMFVPRFVAKWCIAMKWQPIYQPEYDFFANLSQHLINERKGNKSAQAQHNDMLQMMVNAEFSEENLKKTFKEDLSQERDGHHVNAGAEELEREEKMLKNIVGSKYLSEEEVTAQAMIFFLGGYETTASTLSYCLQELAVNPHIQERLYDEIQQAKALDPELGLDTLAKIDYLDAVITEALRKYPPVLLNAREVSEDYYIPELKLTIEKGLTVRFPIYAMHHSAEYYPEPEKYDPERFMPQNRDKITPYTYLPFGGGPRNCIGMRFALTEVKVGLSRIVDRFQVIRVKETTDELTLLSASSFLKTSPIYVGVKARK